MRAFKVSVILFMLLGSLGLSQAAAPIVENVTITGWQDTDNLTLSWDSYDADAEDVVNITNWELNGASYTLLNMPFEGGSSNTYAKDYSGNGYDVQSYGGSPIWNSSGGHDGYGAMDNSISSDSYLNLGGDSSLDRGGTKNVSFELWLKPVIPQSTDYIGGFTDTNVWSLGYGFFYSSSSQVCFHINSYSSNRACGSIAAGSWYHLVGTYNGSEIALYKNGTKVGTDTYSSYISGAEYWGYDFCLGSDCGTSRESYSVIDNVRVYDHALTAEQIASLYADDFSVIHSTETSDGQNWSGCVTPNDMTQDGNASCSDNVTIGIEPGVSYTDVSGCQDIAAGGDYMLSANLSGANITTGSGLSCIKISAPGVRLLCGNHSITNNGTAGTTYGIFVDSVTGARVLNCSDSISGYGYGLYINASDAVNASDVRLFNNTVDLQIDNGLGSPIQIDLNRIIFDNPSGNLTDYTTLSIADNVAAGTSYSVGWNSAISPPPNMSSISGMYAEIENLTGGVSIDELVWHYSDGDVSGRNELASEIWKYNGTWGNTYAQMDQDTNTLTLLDHNPGSVYAILEDTTGATIGAGTGCVYIGSPGYYEMDSDLSGVGVSVAPRSGSACIRINASNVFLDCKGHSLTNGNNITSYGIASIGSGASPLENVIIRNCHVIGYGYSFFLDNTKESLIEDNNATDMVEGFRLIASGLTQGANNTFIRNRAVRATGGRGFVAGAGYSTFRDNYAYAQYGFYSIGTVNNIINNTLTNNPASSGTYGIFSSTPIQGLVENNTITDTDYGIYLDCTACACGNILRNNDISNVDISGIELVAANNMDVLHNGINDAGLNGIHLRELGSFNNEINYNTINNTAYGIRLFNKTGDAPNYIKWNNISHTSVMGINLDRGSFYVSDTVIQGNLISDCASGIVLEGSDGTSLISNEIGGCTAKGVWVDGAATTTMSGDHLYGNSDDLFVEMAGTPQDVNLSNVIFDRPAGDHAGFTNLSIDDTVSAGSSYSVEWVGAAPEAPPKSVFKDTFVNITAISGSVSLESAVWHWYDDYVLPYNESTFELWKHNGSWANTSAARNFVSNTLTLANLVPSSTYAILAEEGSFVIDGCQDVDTSGATYVLGGNLTGTAGLACLNITASNITIDCQGFSITGNSTGYGLLLDGVSNVTLLNCDIGDYERGVFLSGSSGCSFTNMTSTDSDSPFYVEESEDAKFTDCNIERGGKSGTTISRSRRIHIDPTISCGSEIGFLVNQSNDTMIEAIACDNSHYGILVLNSLNATIRHSRTYNNSIDLRVENNLPGPTDLTIANLTFDNPDGDLKDYTTIYMDDAVAAYSSFSMNWSAQPSPLPGSIDSLNNKFLKISQLAGSNPIGNITWVWLDEEAYAFEESLLELWRYNNSWNDTGATLDTGSNSLTLTDHDPEGIYAIVGPFTTNVSSCRLLEASEEYYTLTADLVGSPIALPEEGAAQSACIKVNASNVVLDCAGHSITNNGTGGASRAIIISDGNTNVTVKDCSDLSGYFYGLFASKSSSLTMTNLTVSNNSDGIYLSFINDSTIIDSRTSNNTGSGIHLLKDLHAEIKDSNSTDDNHGFIIHQTNESNITGNRIELTTLNGIYVYADSTGNRISGNFIKDSTQYGVFIDFDSDHNNVSDNTITECHHGVSIDDSWYCTVNGNRINDSDRGIVVHDAASTTLSSNNLSNNIYGINASNTSDTHITSNTVRGGSTGILVDIMTPYSGNVDDNSISGCSGVGLHITRTESLSVNRNHLFNNGYDLRIAHDSSYDAVANYYLYDTIFDNPLGDFQNFTNLSLHDEMAETSSFTIGWSTEPAAPPSPSFEGKYVNISTLSGNVAIDSLTWHWNASESAGHDESKFGLWEYDGSWTQLPVLPDTVQNEFLVSDLDPSGVYGILESNATMCENITSPGTYTMTANAYGAPYAIPDAANVDYACVRIASSDVVFDCDGHNMTNVGAANAAGIAIYGSDSVNHTNVTIRNCPKISSYESGVLIHKSSKDSVDNVRVFNASSGSTGYGIHLYYSDDVNVTNSRFYSSSGDGVRSQFSDRSRFISNWVFLNQNHGFYFTVADDIYLSGNNATQNNYSGFVFTSVDNSHIEGNTAGNNGGRGFFVGGSGNDFISNWAYVNDLGFEVSNADHNNFTGALSDLNTKGFYIFSSNGTIMENVRFFRNGHDLYFKGSSTPGETLVAVNLTFDNPNGGFINETSIDLSDVTASANEEYWINWTSEPATPPGFNSSFQNKHVEISEVSAGLVNISSAKWRWTDIESNGHDESTFRLLEYSGAWSDTGAALDNVSNTLTLTGFSPSSVYSIMEEQPLTEYPFGGCNLITAPGIYTYNRSWSVSSLISYVSPEAPYGWASPTLTGPVWDVQHACVKIDSDNVVFDCKGYELNFDGPGGFPSAGIAVTPGHSNVVIQNCPSIDAFMFGIHILGADGVTVRNVSVSDTSSTNMMGGIFMSRTRFDFDDCHHNSIIDSDVSDSGSLTGTWEPGAGILIQGCQNITLDGIAAHGNSHAATSAGYGLILEDTTDIDASSITFFDNDHDLYIVGDYTSAMSYDMAGLEFRPDSGLQEDYTVLDMADSTLDFETSFYVDWAGPSYLPSWGRSFNEKYVNIRNMSDLGGEAIDQVTWHYTGGELAGYDESRLDIYRSEPSNPGGLSIAIMSDELDATLNAGTDTLTLTDVAPGGTLTGKFGVMEDPIGIDSCQNITEPGRYRLNATLVATQPGRGVCVDIQSDDVVIDLNGYYMSQTSGTGIGIYSHGHSGLKISGSDEHITGYAFGILIDSSSGVSIDPVWSCNNTIGVFVNNSDDILVSQIVACNNSQYGVYVLDSDNTTIEDVRTYNNALDFQIDNNLGSPVTLNISWMLLDNPAGDLQGYTNLSLYDTLAAGDSFSINWTQNTEMLPPGAQVFEGKFLDISGDGPISSVEFHWLDSESIYNGFNEAFLQLFEWNGSSWNLLDATADQVNNALSASNLNPASDYGILYNGTQYAGADLYGADVSNVTHHGRYPGVPTGNVSTEGGNITSVTANTTQLTGRWAAFYGNVSGGIILQGDTSPNRVYSWTWSPEDGGVVCVSTDSSLGFFAAYPAYGSDVDSAWSLTASATDSGTNTFNATDCTLDIGGISVSDTANADTGAAGGFMTCILKSVSSNVTKDDMVFCSEMIPGGTAWNGNAADYEIMVPTPEAVATTETYYFYANLN